jgi:hypothetical protein
MARSTKRQVNERIEEVVRLRLLGYELCDIAQHSAVNGWRVRTRQLQHYIYAADDVLAQQFQQEREKLMTLHISRRADLFRLAVHQQEFRTVLAILCDLAKLQGLYPTRKLDVTESKPPGLPPISEEDRLALLRLAESALGKDVPCTPPGSTPPGFAVGGDGSPHRIQGDADGPPNTN